eukprot:9502174-Pyramimonas_sp.AAC.1
MGPLRGPYTWRAPPSAAPGLARRSGLSPFEHRFTDPHPQRRGLGPTGRFAPQVVFGFLGVHSRLGCQFGGGLEGDGHGDGDRLNDTE